MNDEPATPSEPSLDTPATEVSSGGSTVEEVEEFWRKRMAGKERAWNAEATTLRGQLESRQQQLLATPGAGDGDPNLAGAQLAELNRQLEAERAARVVDQRKLKFPALAAQNVSDAVFASSDEASLARLNVLAEDGNNGTFIAPTSPRKPTPTVAKRPEDMDDAEFKAAFKQAADALDQASQRH